jgi:hypothetical protein
MSTAASQPPAETDRITRAIFEHAALCNHADTWTAGAEQYDDMTVAGPRVRG